jgi:hypothetical protein
MTDADGRTHTIERLQALLNRLTAADLTLAEANQLRAEVHDLLSGSASPAPVDSGSSPFRFSGRTMMACEMVCC